MLIALGDGHASDDENESYEERKPEFLTDEDDTTENAEWWNEVDVEG